MQALSQGLGKVFNCGRAFEVSQDSEQASVVVEVEMRVFSQLFSTWFPVENEVSGLDLPQGPSWALFCCCLQGPATVTSLWATWYLLTHKEGCSLVNLHSDSTEASLVPPLIVLGTDGY